MILWIVNQGGPEWAALSWDFSPSCSQLWFALLFYEGLIWLHVKYSLLKWLTVNTSCHLRPQLMLSTQAPTCGLFNLSRHFLWHLVALEHTSQENPKQAHGLLWTVLGMRPLSLYCWNQPQPTRTKKRSCKAQILRRTWLKIFWPFKNMWQSSSLPNKNSFFTEWI